MDERQEKMEKEGGEVQERTEERTEEDTEEREEHVEVTEEACEEYERCEEDSEFHSVRGESQGLCNIH